MFYVSFSPDGMRLRVCAASVFPKDKSSRGRSFFIPGTDLGSCPPPFRHKHLRSTAMSSCSSKKPRFCSHLHGIPCCVRLMRVETVTYFVWPITMLDTPLAGLGHLLSKHRHTMATQRALFFFLARRRQIDIRSPVRLAKKNEGSPRGNAAE